MLRLQLPILLSFAFLRCLIGQMGGFCVNRFVSQRIKTMCSPVQQATRKTLSFLYATLLGASLWYTTSGYSVWRAKSVSKQPEASLICTEYDNTRVQGLMCASGLLALFTSSDALTLGLALATFKSVADGSIVTLILSMATWSASMGLHTTDPKAFFTILFVFTTLYSTWCYSDERNQFRAHGAIIAASFAALQISMRVFLLATFRTWRGLQRCVQYAQTGFVFAYRYVLRRGGKPREHTD